MCACTSPGKTCDGIDCAALRVLHQATCAGLCAEGLPIVLAACTQLPPSLTWLSPMGLSGCRMEPLQLLPGRGSAPTSSLLPQMRAVDSGRVGLLLRSCSRLCRSSSPCRRHARRNSPHMLLRDAPIVLHLLIGRALASADGPHECCAQAAGSQKPHLARRSQSLQSEYAGIICRQVWVRHKLDSSTGDSCSWHLLGSSRSLHLRVLCCWPRRTAQSLWSWWGCSALQETPHTPQQALTLPPLPLLLPPPLPVLPLLLPLGPA